MAEERLESEEGLQRVRGGFTIMMLNRRNENTDRLCETNRRTRSMTERDIALDFNELFRRDTLSRCSCFDDRVATRVPASSLRSLCPSSPLRRAVPLNPRKVFGRNVWHCAGADRPFA